MRTRGFLAVAAISLFLFGPLFAAGNKESEEGGEQGREVTEKRQRKSEEKEKDDKSKKDDKKENKKEKGGERDSGGVAPSPGTPTQTSPAAASRAGATSERNGGTGTLRGRVLNDAGLPVSGADVTCIDDKGAVVARTLTDDDGVYEFGGLEKGEYTISVMSPGTAGPVEVRFPDSSKQPPGPPLKIVVRELERDNGGSGALRAEWEAVKNAAAYRCELFLKGGAAPLALRSGMIQNFCEFEDLNEDTEYEIRVYAENDSGASERYSSAVFRTAFRPPAPPTGLSVSFAKNNRVDLSWNAGEWERLKGYAIQAAKGSGSYLYLASQGMTSDRNKARIIGTSDRGEVQHTIEGPSLVENLVPYSFRVFSVDKRGAFSKASSPVTGIVLRDTVPPQPPVELRHEFVSRNRLKIRWKAADEDTVRYRVSYGFDKERWDGVAFTSSTSYELSFDPSRLRDKALFVNVAAIDKAGNESGIRPIEKKETVARGETDAGDIVVTAKDLYRDHSGALVPSPKKAAQAPRAGGTPAQRGTAAKTIRFPELKAAGFSVGKGVVARVEGKVRMPENAVIRVMPGGTLVVEGADLGAEGGSWGGILFLEGSSGTLRNSVVRGALTGVAVENNDGGVKINNLQVFDCAENGIAAKASRVELAFVTVQNCRTGIGVLNSAVTVGGSSIRHNERGILAHNYSLALTDSKIEGNREYGLRLYGGGRVERCSFKDNLVGIVLEPGRGSARIAGCRVELNTIDGILSNAPNADITENLVASNGRHGIYLREGANPNITANDIVNNRAYAVFGGGRIARSYVAYNNGSPYYDDTGDNGRPDNVFSSSSSSPVKQIERADYIVDLSFASVLR